MGGKSVLDRVDLIQDMENSCVGERQCTGHRLYYKNRSEYTPGIAKQRAQHKANRQTVYSRGHKHPNMSGEGTGRGRYFHHPVRSPPNAPTIRVPCNATPRNASTMGVWRHVHATLLYNRKHNKNKNRTKKIRTVKKKKKDPETTTTAE